MATTLATNRIGGGNHENLTFTRVSNRKVVQRLGLSDIVLFVSQSRGSRFEPRFCLSDNQTKLSIKDYHLALCGHECLLSLLSWKMKRKFHLARSLRLAWINTPRYPSPKQFVLFYFIFFSCYCIFIHPCDRQIILIPKTKDEGGNCSVL